MSESTGPLQSSRKKKLLIAAIGGAAACVLTAGTVIGVNAGSSKTEQLCAAAVESADAATKIVKTSVETAAAARTQAHEVEGYAQHDGAAALVKAVNTAEADLARINLAGDCDNRDAAESVQGNSGAAKTHATSLDAAAQKLSADVAGYQSEAKRVADEKAAADAAKKAEEAKAAEAAAAEQAAADQAAADQAAAAQPQYAGGGTAYAPAPQSPLYNAPAPVPYVPAPAPVPAWSPPPFGSGPGGPVCVGIGDVVFCTGE